MSGWAVLYRTVHLGISFLEGELSAGVGGRAEQQMLRCEWDTLLNPQKDTLDNMCTLIKNKIKFSLYIRKSVPKSYTTNGLFIYD
jgi:hypothetical protein